MRRPEFLLASLFLALSTTAAATPTAPPAAPAATAMTSPMAAPDMLAAADDITRQVSALRGLSQLKPFAKGVLSRAAIGQKLRERIAKEYTPEEISVEARVLKRLGLLPEGADYQQMLLDLLMEQVAGFYDPFVRQLYIADWVGMDLQRPAIAHEIEHALQDQHFDLKKFASPIKDDGDRQLARSAVVEGDGTAVMLDFLAQQMGIDSAKLPGAIDAMGEQLASGALTSSPIFDSAPRFLRETLLFPYVAGMKFVLKVRGAGPWSRVDDLFKNPPESTEQVLHPAKYLSHEHPVWIAPSPLPSLPGHELRRDVLGELEWKVLFESKLADGPSERAAAGWGGDRLVAYGSDFGPLALVVLSTWDTADDAIQVDSALRKLLAMQTRLPETAADAPAIYVVGDEAWSVERHGKEVLALFGVPSSARAATAETVWKSWKVGAPKPSE